LAGQGQKSLVLILAREFASQLATAMFVSDDEGELVFYNEPAEDILGRPFAKADGMPASELTALFRPETLAGEPMTLGQLPLGIALLERQPAHDVFRITGLDGRRRVVSVTAFPLFARSDMLVGVFSIFWERAEAREG
jgi:PAS domain-containing protein